MECFEFKNSHWFCQPKQFKLEEDCVIIQTEPETDLWQRTYYGFQNDNAHCLLIPTENQYFSFTVKTQFDSKSTYDQCGVAIYQSSNNWFKASMEYETEEFQRLGSVVTTNGYSDWASVDVAGNIKEMFYRLSRRENDFCVENSTDGIHYHQMRIFHMVGENTQIHFGIYACSPGKSSFQAMFTQMEIGECVWKL